MMTENMVTIDARVQETIDGVKATVHSALKGFMQLQEIVDGAKGAVDKMIESVQGTTQEMVEGVKPTADLFEYVQQNPWIVLGGAILMGYFLGSLASNRASGFSELTDRPSRNRASVHDTQAPAADSGR
jgi:ElaB/YqjD/DUF883 family membrane-anchored ribosome-binding protein